MSGEAFSPEPPIGKQPSKVVFYQENVITRAEQAVLALCIKRNVAGLILK